MSSSALSNEPVTLTYTDRALDHIYSYDKDAKAIDNELGATNPQFRSLGPKDDFPAPIWQSAADSLSSTEYPYSTAKIVRRDRSGKVQYDDVVSLVTLGLFDDPTDSTGSELRFDLVNLQDPDKETSNGGKTVMQKIRDTISSCNKDLRQWQQTKNLPRIWTDDQPSCGPRMRSARDTADIRAEDLQAKLVYYSQELQRATEGRVLVGSLADRQKLLQAGHLTQAEAESADPDGRHHLLRADRNFQSTNTHRTSREAPTYIVDVGRDGRGDLVPTLDRYLPTQLTDKPHPVSATLQSKDNKVYTSVKDALRSFTAFHTDCLSKRPSSYAVSLRDRLGLYGHMAADTHSWHQLAKETALAAIQSAAMDILQASDDNDNVEPNFGISSANVHERVNKEGWLKYGCVTDVRPERKQILHEMIRDFSPECAPSEAASARSRQYWLNTARDVASQMVTEQLGTLRDAVTDLQTSLRTVTGKLEQIQGEVAAKDRKDGVRLEAITKELEDARSELRALERTMESQARRVGKLETAACQPVELKHFHRSPYRQLMDDQ